MIYSENRFPLLGIMPIFEQSLRNPDLPDLTRTVIVLNKFGPSSQGEAKVEYLDGDFRVTSPGSYVRCAITGEHIPLDELKYWSVDRQEAYATPEAVLQRHYPAQLKKA
jgi:hypothetical protein